MTEEVAEGTVTPYVFRNAVYNGRGTIDIEIEHSLYGWVPFTADPNDLEEIGGIMHALALQGPVTTYTAPPADEVRANMPALTSRQFWMAAASVGVSQADVIAAVESDETMEALDKSMVIAEINAASSFDRLHPTVARFITNFDIPNEQLDSLWLWALTL